MTLYSFNPYDPYEDDGLETVEAARVTASFWWDSKGNRSALISTWRKWFPSRELAIGDLRMKLVRAREDAQKSLERAAKKLADFDKRFYGEGSQ